MSVDGKRVGRAQGMLLANVVFENVAESGWAVGDLVSWNDLAVDPHFQRKFEARVVTYLELEGTMFHPLTFKLGRFYVYGGPIESCAWLRIFGRDAEVAGSKPPAL